MLVQHAILITEQSAQVPDLGAGPCACRLLPFPVGVSLLPTTQYGASLLWQLLLFAGNKGINKMISALYMLRIKRKKPISISLCGWRGVGVLVCVGALGVCQSLVVFL